MSWIKKTAKLLLRIILILIIILAA